MGEERVFPVIDGHVDLVYDLMRNHPGSFFAELAEGAVTPRSLAAGGVRVLVSALYCADAFNGPGRALPHLRDHAAFAREKLGSFVPLRTPQGLDACLAGAGPPGILTLLENADPLVDLDPEELPSLGLVAVGLTHAGRNRLGDGNGVAAPGGLTAAGRKLLGRLDRLGIALDLAHLAEPCFGEALELFTGPIMSSHTGFRAFCDRPRNLSDGQVAAICARGGIVGVALAPEMLVDKGACTIDDVVRQLDWLVQRHGPKVAAIGSDFGGFDDLCAGMENHGRLPALAERLLARGYPESAVGLIMGGNWRRWYGGILGASPPER
ncbi:membrane dipeptidase [Geobacter sp.]|uniref:dipeptidase n=1 Tax=Geobacter sp. TaxID=46610 RepID=UPI002626F9C7|nr:membrane dipeptidase [Geobacter sp.]